MNATDENVLRGFSRMFLFFLFVIIFDKLWGKYVARKKK